MNQTSSATWTESPISHFRRRQLGSFDSLERNGDFKIINAGHRAIVPRFTTIVGEYDGIHITEESILDYSFPEVSVTCVQDALVAQTGAVYVKEHAIAETIEGLLHENLPYNSGKALQKFDQVVASSRYGNFNHAVFTSETVPLLYMRSMDQQMRFLPTPLVFDRRFCTENYVASHRRFIEHLGLIDISEPNLIDEAVRVEFAIIPTVSRRRGASRASLLTRHIAQLALSASRISPPVDRARMIYVSRRYANSRVPSNIDELESIALKMGFTPVYLEKVDCLEQVLIFQGADVVVAEHGAGLTNLMYCRAGTHIVEIFPKKMYGHWTFRLTAYVSGLIYSAASFPVPDEWLFNRDSVTVDTELFRHCLDVVNKKSANGANGRSGS